MTGISQNAIKSGSFVISGRNSGETEGEPHYYLKKQSQFSGGQIDAMLAMTMAYGASGR
jgi:hypothetical protein